MAFSTGRGRLEGFIRQWKILLALDGSRHGLTFEELRARVSGDSQVTERTIRRDIEVLTFAGLPIELRTGRPTRIVLLRRDWRTSGIVFETAPAQQHGARS